MAFMPRGRTALIAAAVVLAAASGFGQAAKGRAPTTKAGGKAPAAQTAKDTGATRDVATSPSVTPPPMTGRGEAKTSAAAKPAMGDAGVTVVEKDGGAKQFRFTETDIEGRLKAPQIVYFLRRVRAEFAAGDLGHRSFMRELSETRHDPNF
jgi:hypothetical protein